MASTENSLLGLAKQTGFGTPNTTDAAFAYLLFTEGAVSTNNIVRPLDREVGGGALPRDMVKVGVNSGGPIAFIPRPKTLGYFLHGITGSVASAQIGATLAYKHTFKLPTDQFDAPYYTLRSAPGGLWGEQFQDNRVTGLSLEWRGADYVRAMAGFLGGLPAKVSTATWDAPSKVDGGPQFLSPLATLELPTGTAAKVLAGSFTAVTGIPLDQQYIVGSYTPDALDIQNRSFLLNLEVKVTDAVLHGKMAYDPAGGSAWAAEVFREADLTIEFPSDRDADTGEPYKFTIAANGNSGDNANVIWSVAPIGLRAGRQVTMQVTGLFTASPDGSDPLTVELVNTLTTY